MEMSKKNSMSEPTHYYELNQFSGGSFQVQSELQVKQTLALASDGTARSLFPTITRNNFIHTRRDQVVIKLIATKCST